MVSLFLDDGRSNPRVMKKDLSMSTTALITGGTSGIGRAVAKKMAQLSIHVL
jgi:NADP-dependent 3-hydroxy acid dehydrogenase YdfG